MLKPVTGNPDGRPVVLFIGENGSGKSTLLEAIAVANGFNAEDGLVKTAYEETEHYQVMKSFMSNREGMLKELLL